MISLGDDWVLDGFDIYHACGPELLHRWTGAGVCECGGAVPHYFESFYRWLCEQRADAEAAMASPGQGSGRRAVSPS